MTAADVRSARERLDEGLAAAAAASRTVGEPLDPEAPYAGLCALDPAHGPAVTRARAVGGADPIPACADCAEAAERGQPRARRTISVAGRIVPFDEADTRGLSEKG
jgi:hypothetical protein